MSMDLNEHPPRLSDLACELCKRKKSRCDRQLPACSLCHRAGRHCVYPKARLKPGPKLGTVYTRRRGRSSDAGKTGVARPKPLDSDAFSPDWASCDSRTLQESTSGAYQLRASSVASSSSPKTPRPDIMALNFANAVSISSLFHPSHEAPVNIEPEQNGRVSPGFLLAMTGVQEKLTKVCQALNLPIQQIQSLIDLYFEGTAGLRQFSLFHQPTFSDKIRDMSDHNHLTALFAAMCAIASRFSSTSTDDPTEAEISGGPSHQEFHNLSLEFITLSLDACTNCAPSLCLLQAMTLAGFYKLASGVYGPAWRLVGSTIRVAYELKLHLIDYEGFVEAPTSEAELRAWSLNEERRRCWWALWEMDIFASTIQRAPTAIDRTMNETCLPVSDEFWFAGKYQASCLLQSEPEERWQKLKASGNEDCFAWCIVLSSLMRDAQILSHGNIQGIFSNLEPKNNVSKLVQYFSHGYKRKTAEEKSQQLGSLVKAYHKLLENLPAALQHHGEPLPFGLDEVGDARSSRRFCGGKYNTRMLAVSVHFMIYQNYVFAGIVDGTIPLSLFKAGEEPRGQFPTPHQASPYSIGLKKLLDTSDTVLELVESCPKDHARYVSPYYASTIWIAAALQLFKGITVYDDDPVGSQRKYAALREAYLQFTRYWGTPLALLENLDSLEARLRVRQQEFPAPTGDEQTSQMSNQQPQHETTLMGSADTGITVADHGQPFHCEPDARESPFPNPMPLCDIPAPMMGHWSSSEETADWPATTDQRPVLQINQDAAAPTLAQEAMLDNFAWYSSDIMTELFQGYTT